MPEHVLLGMVHDLDGHDQDMGEGVEPCQVLAGIVTRLVQTARVEKCEKGSFRSGKLVLARKAGAGFKSLSDLGLVGAGQVSDDGSLATLSFPKQPNHRDRRPLTQFLPSPLKPLFRGVRIQTAIYPSEPP